MKRAVWVQKTLIFSTILGIMAAWDCLITTIGRRVGIPPNGCLGSGNRPKHSGLLGGGFKCFFMFAPIPGEMIQFD